MLEVRSLQIFDDDDDDDDDNDAVASDDDDDDNDDDDNDNDDDEDQLAPGARCWVAKSAAAGSASQVQTAELSWAAAEQ